jgi:hypothetical protein
VGGGQRLTVGRVRQDLCVRRLAAPALLLALAAAAAGCGGGGDDRVDLPEREAGLGYRGTTSQDEAIRVQVERDRLVARFPLALRCRDGSRTEATVATEPDHPRLEADGSFYYSETGRADFRGFGEGRYRAAVQGEVQGEAGSGSASFRISFRATSCRASVTWRVRRESA